MNLKLFLASAALVLSATWRTDALAEDFGVVVIGPEGVVSQIAFPRLDRIQLGANGVSLLDVTGASVDVSYDDVEKIEIGAEVKDMSGIDALVASGNIAVWPTQVTDVLNVAGAPANTQVDIFSLNGSLVMSAQAGPATTTMNLSLLAPGAYVVNVGSSSFKIVKKS